MFSALFPRQHSSSAVHKLLSCLLTIIRHQYEQSEGRCAHINPRLVRMRCTISHDLASSSNKTNGQRRLEIRGFTPKQHFSTQPRHFVPLVSLPQQQKPPPQCLGPHGITWLLTGSMIPYRLVKVTHKINLDRIKKWLVMLGIRRKVNPGLRPTRHVVLCQALNFTALCCRGIKILCINPSGQKGAKDWPLLDPLDVDWPGHSQAVRWFYPLAPPRFKAAGARFASEHSVCFVIHGPCHTAV